MFNSRNLGALIVDERPHVREWDEPQFNIQNLGIEENYGFGVLNEETGDRCCQERPRSMRSAFERLLRMGQLTVSEHAAAGGRLEQLRRGWRELQPSQALRSQAETFLMSYALKAADALQLAAAYIWCSGQPQNYAFISGDAQLLEAARHVGFQIVAA